MRRPGWVAAAACLLACGAASGAPARRRVLLDTDPGVDDVLALLWLCARQDAVEIVALTTPPGNVGVRTTLGNALRALRFFGCPEGIRLGVGLERDFGKGQMVSTLMGSLQIHNVF